MRIRITNPATSRLYNEDLMDEPVEFASTGTARVPKDVGERLVAEYDVIESYEPDNDD